MKASLDVDKQDGAGDESEYNQDYDSRIKKSITIIFAGGK